MDKTKLAGMVKESVSSFYREQAEKDLRKEIAERAEEEFGKEVMPKRKFNALAKYAYNLKAEDEAAELTEIIDLLDELNVS